MLRIGVIGQSGSVSPKVEHLAEAVGAAIAEMGAALLTGGTDGVMEAASRGAKAHGGLVVGILPGRDPQAGNVYIDIPITTGLGMDYRSMILAHSSDAVIMIGGGVGTLLELAGTYWQQKPLVVMAHSGGWAERLPEVVYDGGHLDHRRTSYPRPLAFAQTAQEAVDAIRRQLDPSPTSRTSPS